MHYNAHLYSFSLSNNNTIKVVDTIILQLSQKHAEEAIRWYQLQMENMFGNIKSMGT